MNSLTFLICIMSERIYNYLKLPNLHILMNIHDFILLQMKIYFHTCLIYIGFTGVSCSVLILITYAHIN